MKLAHRSTQGRLPTSSFDLVNDAGEVVGFTQVRHRPSCNSDLPPEAGNNIYYQIEAPFRGRGYGKVLMGLALAEAKRIGLTRVRLTYTEDNPTSRHIIESHGRSGCATSFASRVSAIICWKFPCRNKRGCILNRRRRNLSAPMG